MEADRRPSAVTGTVAGDGAVGLLGCCCPAAPIELKTKRPAEGRQRPLGGIGFRRLEGDVVHLAGGGAAAFAGAMAFPDDGCALRLHGDADPGDIDGEESALVFAGKDAFGFDGLPAPAVKAEDPVGLRDRVPAFEIGEFPAMGLAGADMSGDRVGAAAPAPVLLRSPSPCPHAQNRFRIGEGGAGNLGAAFEIMARIWRRRRGSPGSQ